jgi:uncharacterized protein
MNCSVAVLLAALVVSPCLAAERKVLVYTRNYTSDGKGYVHDNIQSSSDAIRRMGAEAGFAVDASDNPAVFTTENLKQYWAIVFSNSNNEAFASQAQRDAFKAFIEGGGGFAGIHSATGSEREWPWFWSLIGGKFARHPPLQKFTVRVKDPSHPATKGMPASFAWEDECYFNTFLNPNIHPLLVTDPAQLNDPDRGKYPFDLVGNAMPLSWVIRSGPGRVFYTALGHTKAHYTNPLLYNHIKAGILWVLERDPK